MQSFFITRPRTNHRFDNIRKEEDNIELSWVIKTINKVSLQVQDVKMKLDLNKVVKFLEKPVEIERKRSHIMTFCPSPASSQ